MENIDINDFEGYLDEGDFPAATKELVKSAGERGAPEEILALLGEMPEMKFTSYSDLKTLLNDFILKQREIGPR